MNKEMKKAQLSGLFLIIIYRGVYFNFSAKCFGK